MSLLTDSSASSHVALSSRRTAKEGRRPELERRGCEPGPEAPCTTASPLPTAQALTPHTHTGPFFSKPCRWAAQEARAARMYRKTLIWRGRRLGRGIIRGQTAPTPPHGGPAVGWATPEGDPEDTQSLLALSPLSDTY